MEKPRQTEVDEYRALDDEDLKQRQARRLEGEEQYHEDKEHCQDVHDHIIPCEGLLEVKGIG